MSEMTFERMIAQMTPTIYDSLKQAVALRKWPDGKRLSDEQTELCLEAVMRYEIEHNVPESERVGYMQGSCKSQTPGGDGEDSIKWIN
ncbi:DUF1315 family protein [Halomonas sp. HP20-15]|uniref:YeaC family protein n=1 Tax=Halomonas sp. HP20-15 TaxID=3085901 RepID=UPI002982698B|nr:DUF1315 family protein [Halomonas sp. HP20-15]MDW5378144.1 DUF1315 family protein [Halomonas sp. HP20-15]